MSGSARARLVSDQRAWLAYRNTCLDDDACLRRRYASRLTDLGVDVPGPSTGDASEIVERRIRNGRFESVLADGTIIWSAVDGSTSGADLPDASLLESQFIQVLPDTPIDEIVPPLGERLESALLAEIDFLLPAQDRAPYRTLLVGITLEDRIFRHVSALSFLASR